MDEIFSGDLIIQAEKEEMYLIIKKTTGFDCDFYHKTWDIGESNALVFSKKIGFFRKKEIWFSLTGFQSKSGTFHVYPDTVNDHEIMKNIGKILEEYGYTVTIVKHWLDQSVADKPKTEAKQE